MSRFFQRLREFRNIAYTKYLGITNVCTTCGLLCFGDVIIQGVEVTYYKYKNPGVKSTPGKHEADLDLDRTGRIFQVGIPYGIMNHVWYKNLDKWFPGKGKALVLKKTLVDTAVAGPSFICLYFYGMALTEKKGIKGSWEALKEVFLPVYTADVCYWPLAQAVNFYLVPNRYRVLVISICALFWNTFLSFVQHLENDPEQDPLHLSLDTHHMHDDLQAHKELQPKSTDSTETAGGKVTPVLKPSSITEASLKNIQQRATAHCSANSP